MAVASNDQPGRYADGGQRRIDVEASEIIYNNTPVGLNGSGYARALNAGDIFGGWNKTEQIDNSDGSAGDEQVVANVEAYPKLSVTGADSAEDEGKKVYATDDTTFTTTPPAPGSGTCIGRIHQYLSAGVAYVHAYLGADMESDSQSDGVVTVTTEATAGNVTYTAAEILGGVIVRDPNGADRTDVTPTAALLVAAMDDAVVGKEFNFVIVSNPAAADEESTLTAGAGITLVPATALVPYLGSRSFKGVCTNVTGAAEAITIYMVDEPGELDGASIKDLAIDTEHLAGDAVENAKIADDAVSLEHLDDGILPSHVVKYAGEFAWSGSGTSKAETVTGALATDIVVGSIQTVPTEAAYLVSLAVTDNTVTAVLSAANTTNDAVISYVVYRAAA